MSNLRTFDLRRLRRRLSRYLAPLDESVIVYQALGIHDGLMLDVGAHYGYSLRPFAEHGWTVHAFEPDPANRAHLVMNYDDNERVTIVPVAVGDEPRTMTLYTSHESTGVSSLLAFTRHHEATATVDVIRLRDYMIENDLRHVDFLKIDVEGYEKFVLDGYDWSIEPTAIVLEFEDAKTVPIGYNWRHLADRLRDGGYTVIVSEWYPPLRYGAEHRWRCFRRYPCELVDPRATGNLLAFKGIPRRRIRMALFQARVRVAVRPLARRLRSAAPRSARRSVLD
jgi:FkbM family methyltransferase